MINTTLAHQVVIICFATVIYIKHLFVKLQTFPLSVTAYDESAVQVITSHLASSTQKYSQNILHNKCMYDITNNSLSSCNTIYFMHLNVYLLWTIIATFCTVQNIGERKFSGFGGLWSIYQFYLLILCFTFSFM